MTDKTANLMSLVNEAFVLLCTYHMYPLTDFITDTVAREKVGMSLVIVAAVNLLLNLGLIFVSNIKVCTRKIKLKFLRVKQK